MSRAVDRINRFIAPSRFCAEKHAEYGFSRDIDVVPYFVPEVDSKKSKSPHPRAYFLFAGRLEDYKGVQSILPQFAGKGSSDLVVVGSGPYEVELRERARSMPRVHFVGWVAPEAMGPYYDHALAVIVPSMTYETFGLVQVEAFAHSTPAIVNNLGPLPAINRQAGCDLVYDDLVELSAHLQALSGDECRRAKIGVSAREAYSKYWTASTHLDAYESLITSAKC